MSNFLSYPHFVEWVRSTSPALFRIGQFIKWILQFPKRHPTAFLLDLAVLSILVFAPVLISEISSYTSYFWMAAILLLLFTIAAMGVSIINKKMIHFVEKDHRYKQSLRIEMLRELQKGDEQLVARIEAQGQQQEQLLARIKAQGQQFLVLDQKITRLTGFAPVFNFGDYQTFNRRLTNEHRDVLENEWARKLDIQVTPRSLAYLAHRICVLESSSKGRLASTIENAVLRVLVASAVKNEKLRVLEIGTLFGVGLAAIYDHASSLFSQIHLTAIDPLDGYYGKNMQDIITNEIISEQIFLSNLARAGVPERAITLIKAMSTEEVAIAAAAKLPHDVLIIDGDHSYDGVKADFDNYLGAVKKCGYIIFDDYDAPEWPDIKKFVDTDVRNHSDVALVGISWRTAVFRVTCHEMNGEHPTADSQRIA